MPPKPLYDGSNVQLPNSEGKLEAIGGLALPSTLSHLVRVKTFLYRHDAGQISVRLEQKSRGSEAGYWVAYKRVGGKLHKTYICEAYALDPYNLEDAATRLLAPPEK